MRLFVAKVSVILFKARLSMTSKLIALGILLISSLILSACGGDNSSSSDDTVSIEKNAEGSVSDNDFEQEAQPVVFNPSSLKSKRFQAMDPAETGLDFEHKWDLTEDKEYRLNNAFAGGGVAMGDYDGDGKTDICLTRPFGGSRLFRNLGNFNFEDVTAQSGFGDDQFWGAGVSFVDIDGDGDLDIYLCGFDTANRLYINQGDGSFKERAREFGLDFKGASIMMAFSDYDLDGDLDAYLLTNNNSPAVNVKVKFTKRDGKYRPPKEYEEKIDFITKPDGTRKIIEAAQFDHLYRNNGDGTFTDVSKQSGIGGNYFGLSATWWDFDDDGWPDLYVANDFYGPDQLYRNNGDGTFVDVTRDQLPHTPWFSMGSDAGDINNDGLLDYLASDMSATSHYRQKIAMGNMGVDGDGWFLTFPEPRQYMRNALYLNTGETRFMEIAYLAGMANSNWTWTVKLSDLDNDGWLDVFIANGMTRDWFNSDLRYLASQQTNAKAVFNVFKNSEVLREPNMAFRNNGDLTFENVGERWGLDHLGVSFGAAVGDLDNDGDLDIVVNNFEDKASLFRNNSSEHNYLKLRLVGRSKNPFGIGAKIAVKIGAQIQVRYLTLASGFMSNSDPIVHFGLGKGNHVDVLIIDWPGGNRQIINNLSVNQLHIITEPEASYSPVQSGTETAEAKGPMFASSERAGKPELPFDDFARQPLLPHKLSQLGPGVAWLDGDGADGPYVYIGGSKGHPGNLLKVNEQGQWTDHIVPAFLKDRRFEDMTPLFFDADGDGDADLYVVSGSIECNRGDEILQDRLYMNQGKGRYSKAPSEALPDMRESGSVVVAADFDRDGDLDLFVGGRVIPGEYPLTPKSYLLKNIGGNFEDVTLDVAHQLRNTGLVTSAIWSDTNNDGWVDLLVSHEWGPVKLYLNRQGQLLEDITIESGLNKYSGWWNSIAGGDIDNDGDIDYAVTNFGLNTKYHASAEKPFILYYGKLDQSGNDRLIEAEFEGDTLYPVRGRSCSTSAIPALANRFGNFENFALSSLQEIYSPKLLFAAEEYSINTLESGIFINDGKGHFSFNQFPAIAQASPGFGIAIADIDGDGAKDIYLVQNFFSSQRETGRMDGGVSMLLRGNGDGNFQPIWPNESGLIVPGDAKGLAMADMDGNGWLDFIVGTNGGKVHKFLNSGDSQNHIFTIRLQGKSGNPTAVGARVTVNVDGMAKQTSEVYAGGGYLSQSTADLSFGLGRSVKPNSIEIRWPNGKVSRHQPSTSRSRIVIEEPESLK
jgi:hypothetical protein